MMSNVLMDSVRAAMFFEGARCNAQTRFAEPVLVLVNRLAKLIEVFLRYDMLYNCLAQIGEVNCLVIVVAPAA